MRKRIRLQQCVLKLVPKIGRVGPNSGIATLVHVEVVVNDLKEFLRLGNASGFDLGPDRKVVQGHFKGPRGDELGLDEITQKKDHEAGVEFVFQQPLIPRRRDLTGEEERVQGSYHTHDHGHFGESNELGQLGLPHRRREIVALNGEVGIFLMQYAGILLKNLPVPSGIAAMEIALCYNTFVFLFLLFTNKMIFERANVKRIP